MILTDNISDILPNKYALTRSTKNLFKNAGHQQATSCDPEIFSPTYTIGAKLVAIRCQIWQYNVSYHMY